MGTCTESRVATTDLGRRVTASGLVFSSLPGTQPFLGSTSALATANGRRSPPPGSTMQGPDHQGPSTSAMTTCLEHGGKVREVDRDTLLTTGVPSATLLHWCSRQDPSSATM